MATPIRRQYLDLKRRHPDAILFFRMGDFYETFDDDAVLCARELEITLTSREMGKGHRVPMAGVPHHAAESYVARLIQRGHRVAIVEQLSDPATTKGIVERDVVRIVTPGTVVEPGMLEPKANNYLVAVAPAEREAGIAALDITTGEFSVTQVPLIGLGPELERLAPAEIIAPRDVEVPGVPRNTPVTRVDAWKFDLDTARQALLRHFKVSTLEGFGCEHLPHAIIAAGVALGYAQETQRAAVPHLVRLTTYSTERFMALDQQTRRNLEILLTARTGQSGRSLLAVLDQTGTPMGGRLVKRWLSQPLLDREQIVARHDAVAALHADSIARTLLVKELARVADLERLANRVSLGIALPRELLALRRSLEAVPTVRDLVPEALASHVARLDPCEDVQALIAAAIADDTPATLADGGVIRAGYSAELDDLRTAARDGRTWIANLERVERERTGIRSLKVGYNRVFGYYLEITNPNLDAAVPAAVRKQVVLPDGSSEPCRCPSMREHLERCFGYSRKQTMVGAERFITPELKEYEAKILNAQELQVKLEQSIYKDLCQQIATAAERLLATAAALAELDVYTAFAEVAVRNRYVRPEMVDEPRIEITGARHPVVEQLVRDPQFVPNDVLLEPKTQQAIVLTGPNMAGKSTYILTAAVIVLMAQVGSFVPADRAVLGVVDRIYTRVGAQMDLSAGQSTFMVEMAETALALLHATSRSLLVFDEIGRGTSTFDGLAIARAVLEFLVDPPGANGARPLVLFATHYHELSELEQVYPQIRNYRTDIAENEEGITFLYRIVPGAADRSYGVHVAKLAGVPKEVVDRANELLKGLEQASARAFKVGGIARQLRLIEPAAPAHPIVDQLAKLDLDNLTPRQALELLAELQAEVQQRGRRSPALRKPGRRTAAPAPIAPLPFDEE